MTGLESVAPSDEIARLLDGSPEPISDLTRQLVACLLRAQPSLEPTVRLGWRSINFRHPCAGHLCAVFPLKDVVRLYFEHGRLLLNEAGLLQGNGKQVGAISLSPGSPIPEDAIGLLLAEAIALKS